MNNQENSVKKIVIVGGGFGGVRLAKLLYKRPELQITLISDQDYFAYYPQLYHAATGGSRSEAAIPLSELFSDTSVRVVIDKLEKVNPTRHDISTVSGQTFAYDYLVLALGNVTNYFGISGMEEYSYNIKTIAGADKFKRHLHQELMDEHRLDANYVIVGAGPTGVELSSVLGEYLRKISVYHKVSTLNLKVDLVEAAPRVLPRSPEEVSTKISDRLGRLGVTVMTGVTVEGETATKLKLKGKDLVTETVVWTAGVANNPFYKLHPEIFSLSKNGRVAVDEHLMAVDDVYVIGDNADTQYSGMAQTAIADANYLARDIVSQIKQGQRKPYKPAKPISVIPVGKGWAVVEWGNLKIYGRLGWWLRRLADLIAYHDIESWPKAVRVWLKEPLVYHDCPVCKD